MKRERKQWENEEILQIGRREAHTDFKRHDNFSEKLSLNGEWKFLFLKAPEYSPEHFEEKNYADESWDEIKDTENFTIQMYGICFQSIHRLYHQKIRQLFTEEALR